MAHAGNNIKLLAPQPVCTWSKVPARLDVMQALCTKNLTPKPWTSGGPRSWSAAIQNPENRFSTESAQTLLDLSCASFKMSTDVGGISTYGSDGSPPVPMSRTALHIICLLLTMEKMLDVRFAYSFLYI